MGCLFRKGFENEGLYINSKGALDILWQELEDWTSGVNVWVSTLLPSLRGLCEEPHGWRGVFCCAGLSHHFDLPLSLLVLGETSSLPSASSIDRCRKLVMAS